MSMKAWMNKALMIVWLPLQQSVSTYNIINLLYNAHHCLHAHFCDKLDDNVHTQLPKVYQLDLRLSLKIYSDI